MKIIYYLAGSVFGLYLLGLASVVYENHYKPHKYWQSIQKARKAADQDVELIAAKKRHPTGKQRG